MSYLPGKFVWFEHQSTDTARAARFYEALFGWRTEAMPMGAQNYSMIMNGSNGIGGYSKCEAGAPNRWMAYMSVSSVDASFAAAQRAGAKSLMPPTDFGPVGRGAALADPTGAVFSLWKSAQGDRPDATETPPGDWVWNELWTGDPSKALAFYEGVFGFSHESMDMGPGGSYTLLKMDGVHRAGMAQSVNAAAASMWLPYVEVSDCDASAAKADECGGQLLSAPADIPGVGRFAIVADPLGAAVAMLRSTQRVV
ncbi:MAG: VOC family protein [Burkholderiaceae bacterium]